MASPTGLAVVKTTKTATTKSRPVDGRQTNKKQKIVKNTPAKTSIALTSTRRVTTTTTRRPVVGGRRLISTSSSSTTTQHSVSSVMPRQQTVFYYATLGAALMTSSRPIINKANLPGRVVGSSNLTMATAMVATTPLSLVFTSSEQQDSGENGVAVGDAGEDHEHGVIFHTSPWHEYLFPLLLLFPIVTVLGNALVVMLCSIMVSQNFSRSSGSMGGPGNAPRKLSWQRSCGGRTPTTTATNCYLISLASADLLIGAVVMPLALYLEWTDGRWELGTKTCDIWLTVDHLATSASILSLAAIAQNRYFAIARPVIYSNLQRQRRLIFLGVPIGFIWVVSTAVAVPIAFGLNDVADRKPQFCKLYRVEYLLYTSVVSFFIPSIAIGLQYVAVFRALGERARRMMMRRVSVIMQRVRASSIAGSSDGQPLSNRVSTVGEPTVRFDMSLSVPKFGRSPSEDLVGSSDNDCSSVFLNNESNVHRNQFSILRPYSPIMRQESILSDPFSPDYNNRKRRKSEPFQIGLFRSRRHRRHAPPPELELSPTPPSSPPPSSPMHHQPNNNTSNNKAKTAQHPKLEGHPSLRGKGSIRSKGSNHVDKETGNGGSRGGFITRESFNNSFRFIKRGRMAPRSSSLESVVSSLGSQRAVAPPSSKRSSEATEDYRVTPYRHSSQLSTTSNTTASLAPSGDYYDDRSDTASSVAYSASFNRRSGLSKIASIRRRHRAKRNESRLSRERRATVMLSVVLVLFYACWLPYFLATVSKSLCAHFDSRSHVEQVEDEQCIPDVVMHMLAWLGHANSMANPFVYAVFNPEFRAAFWRIIANASTLASDQSNPNPQPPADDDIIEPNLPNCID